MERKVFYSQMKSVRKGFLGELLSILNSNINKKRKNECKTLMEKQNNNFNDINDRIDKIEEGIDSIKQFVDTREQYNIQESNLDKIIDSLEELESSSFKMRNIFLRGLFLIVLINVFGSIIFRHFDLAINRFFLYEWSWQLPCSEYLVFFIFCIVGIIVSWLTTKYMHHEIAKKILKSLLNNVSSEEENESSEGFKSRIKATLELKDGNELEKIKRWRFITPDYYYAEYYKVCLDSFIQNKDTNQQYPVICNCELTYPNEQICNCQMNIQRASKRTYILLCNAWNLSISVCLVSLSLALGYKFTYEILLYFIIPHLLWRSVEIFFSFYYDAVNLKVKIVTTKSSGLSQGELVSRTSSPNYLISASQDNIDVINEWKTSSLRKTHRVVLSLFSLIEIILLYSILYYALHHVGLEGYSEGSVVYYYEMLLHSISLAVFNISFNPSYQWWEKLLHVSQLVVCINLIILSLASYLNLTDVLSVKDKERIIHNKVIDWKKNNENSSSGNDL